MTVKSLLKAKKFQGCEWPNSGAHAGHRPEACRALIGCPWKGDFQFPSLPNLVRWTAMEGPSCRCCRLWKPACKPGVAQAAHEFDRSRKCYSFLRDLGEAEGSPPVGGGPWFGWRASCFAAPGLNTTWSLGVPPQTSFCFAGLQLPWCARPGEVISSSMILQTSGSAFTAVGSEQVHYPSIFGSLVVLSDLSAGQRTGWRTARFNYIFGEWGGVRDVFCGIPVR